jgi:DNA-binding MarR family transcriptional regulator
MHSEEGRGEIVDVSQLGDLIMSVARRLRRRSMAELDPIGVTHAQARVMRVLAAAPEAIRMADLACAVEVVPRVATSLVDALEAEGYVGRRHDDKDRRSVLVSLTPAGRRLLDRLGSARRLAAEEVLGALSETDRRELGRVLGPLSISGRLSQSSQGATGLTTASGSAR